MIRIVSGLCFILTFAASASDCFDAAGRDYRIDPDLLRAVAFRESSMNPRAMNIVSQDKYAVGQMQIHSQNFSHLSQFGITPQKLYSDSCMNVYTGAYYLAIAFKRWGVNWESVGAYNAGFSKKPEQKAKRLKYGKEVHQIYMNIKNQKVMR